GTTVNSCAAQRGWRGSTLSEGAESPPQPCMAITTGNGPLPSGLKSCACRVAPPEGMSTGRGAGAASAAQTIAPQAIVESARNAVADRKRIGFMPGRYGADNT